MPVAINIEKLRVRSLDVAQMEVTWETDSSVFDVLDYTFQRDTWKPLRALRVGLNGSWRDDYLFGINNGQELGGGATHLVNGYVMRDQKIWNQVVRIRAGVRNLVDLENSKIRKIGFTTMANGANVYRYSYVVPVQYDLNLSVKF